LVGCSTPAATSDTAHDVAIVVELPGARSQLPDATASFIDRIDTASSCEEIDGDVTEGGPGQSCPECESGPVPEDDCLGATVTTEVSGGGTTAFSATPPPLKDAVVTFYVYSTAAVQRLQVGWNWGAGSNDGDYLGDIQNVTLQPGGPNIPSISSPYRLAAIQPLGFPIAILRSAAFRSSHSVAFIKQGTSRRVKTPAGLLVTRSYYDIVFRPRSP
jgi:hypothetical protein